MYRVRKGYLSNCPHVNRQCYNQASENMTEIAYINESMKASLTNDSGKTPVPLEGPGDTQTWPSWSPNGRYVAYSAFSSGMNGHGRIGVFLHDLSTGLTEEIFANKPGSDGIARKTPHYALWSPNGKMISLITRPRVEGLSAYVYSLTDQGPPIHVHDGFPLFSSWSRNSKFLLFHSGPKHFLIDFEGEINPRLMPGDSRLYMSPSWSPRGSIMGVLNEGREYQSSLMIVDVENLSAQSLTEFTGNGAFAWSPEGESLAVTRETQGESRFYNGIWLVSLDGSERKIVHDIVLAFFWSPNGKELAYVTTSENAEGSVRWSVYDLKSEEVRYLSDFRPTEEQLNLFMFFDQYAQSHNPWSPDGSALIYSGALGYTKARDPLPQQEDAHIIVENTATGDTSEVARGVVGAWSPQP